MERERVKEETGFDDGGAKASATAKFLVVQYALCLLPTSFWMQKFLAESFP